MNRNNKPRPATAGVSSIGTTNSSGRPRGQSQSRRMINTFSTASPLSARIERNVARQKPPFDTSFRPSTSSRKKLRPRIRPQQTRGIGGQNRNRSSIPQLIGQGLPESPRRIPPPARRWPWQERAGRSDIQISNPVPPLTDVNNNEMPGRRQGRELWPWQRRALISAIFPTDENQAATATTPVRGRMKWPWQEHAFKSHIFNEPEEKPVRQRNYNWDQRRSTPFFPPPAVAQSSRSSVSKWPWQEKAKESLLFTPLIPEPPRPFFYPWDQRQSCITGVDPDAKFEGVSRYHEEYVKKDAKEAMWRRPAGKSCYGVLMDEASQFLGGKRPAGPEEEDKENHNPREEKEGDQNQNQSGKTIMGTGQPLKAIHFQIPLQPLPQSFYNQYGGQGQPSSAISRPPIKTTKDQETKMVTTLMQTSPHHVFESGSDLENQFAKMNIRQQEQEGEGRPSQQQQDDHIHHHHQHYHHEHGDNLSHHPHHLTTSVPVVINIGD